MRGIHIRPRSDALDDWLDTYGGAMLHGTVGAQEHPWDWADDVTEDLAGELQQQLSRKIVPGFYVGVQKKYPAKKETT